jgi:phosphatidylglycerol:prolipoprotein diacylglycerol transferase
MPLFAIPFPAIDPVAISLGPFAIRWYALAYIVGLLMAGAIASRSPDGHRISSHVRMLMTFWCGRR